MQEENIQELEKVEENNHHNIESNVFDEKIPYDINPSINYICYNQKQIDEKTISKWDVFEASIKSPCVHWLDIIGKVNTKYLQQFGSKFNLHPLVLDDIETTDERLKIDYFTDYLYIVIKALNYTEESGLDVEQVSIVLGNDFLVSFQELEPNQFNSIKNNLRASKGRIRNLGADYLAYKIYDLLVDNYFVVLEKLSDEIEEIEEQLIIDSSKDTLQSIYRLKRDSLLLRKTIWPLREIVSGLSKSESKLIKESTRLYFRDVYDHVIQILETLEAYREMLSGMLDIYLSSLSNKMNEIMKVLTIIATIFIPLTFIVGWYGMNLLMPEFNVWWSYPIVIAVCIVVVIGMIFYFRRKKWI